MACRSAASSTGWTTARSPPRSRRGGRCDARTMSGDTLAVLAVALAASWASGINTYAVVLVLGIAQRLGFVTLPHDLQVLGSAWVLATAGLLFALNFFADKIPLVDSLNDALHTFVRIPAGALLAYGAADSLGPQAGTIAALLGGTLAAGTHVAKTGTRALINTSPEPFSNIAASLAEDGLVIGGCCWRSPTPSPSCACWRCSLWPCCGCCRSSSASPCCRFGAWLDGDRNPERDLFFAKPRA